MLFLYPKSLQNFRFMKKTIFRAAVALFGVALVACGKAPVATAPAEYAVMTVESSQRVVPSLYSAMIRGRQSVEILPQVSGTISERPVNEGDKVEKGQTLFVIDQVPYRAAVATAKANVDAAAAAVATAQLTYDSKRELHAKKVVSEFDLRMAENTLLTAKAQRAQAEAQLINAENNLSYTVVKAPSSGFVGTLPYNVGALVSPSIPTPLTTVADNSSMYVYFSMNETRALELTRKYGSNDALLKAMPEVELQLSDGKPFEHKGYIEGVSGVVDPSTGTVQFRAVFPNPERILRSGSTGNVVIPNIYDNCIVIPQSTTFELQDKVYVYMLVDGKATSSMVDVEPISNGKEYIVKSGLNVGDVIIAEGVGLLREGTPVVAQKAPQAAPAAEQSEQN